MKTIIFKCILFLITSAYAAMPESGSPDSSKESDIIPESHKSLVRELYNIKIAEFSVEDTPLEEVMKKLFSMLPQNVKYIKGYKIQNTGKTDTVRLSVRDIDLGILISYITSSSGLYMTESSGILEFRPYSSIPNRVLVSLTIKDEIAQKLGFFDEKGETVDVEKN